MSMQPSAASSSAPVHAGHGGFSLPELMITMTILLVIFGGVVTGLNQLANAHRTVWNRTEMHSSVRGATELLQQEVGQAGRVALPAAVTTTGAITTAGTATVGVTSTSGMFVGEQLIFDAGDNIETVTLTALNTGAKTVTGTFGSAHATGISVNARGAFGTGVVPPNMTNGSTGTSLKLYGDINDDGNMVYVEYTCDTTAHYLYRNMMAWDATSKPAVTAAQVLLNNVVANPGGTACFTYQTAAVNTNTYVTNVAITLTVQTQQKDPITQQYQTETKALLNVSPRNTFGAWELASIGLFNRVQPMPSTITTLIQ